MKNLKKNILTTLAFIFGLTAALGGDVLRLVETPIFREVPGSSPFTIMQNISFVCTLNGVAPTCSASGLPSARRKYWNDAGKSNPSGGIPSSSVFYQSYP